MVIYGYEHQSLLRATIAPPKNLPNDKIYELKAKVSWLACKDLCVPGKAELSCRILGPTTGPIDWLSGTVPEGFWPENGSPPFEVAVSGNVKTKLVSFTGNAGATYELFPDLGSSDGRTTIGHVTSLVTPSDQGPVMLFSIPWDGPSLFKALLVEKKGKETRAWWLRGNSANASVPEIKHIPFSLGVLIAALFSGFLGGMILNLMPCVLPVISLKLFSFISQAGESPTRIFRHGLAFAAGIFLWFLGLGVLIIVLKAGGTQVTWGAFQFQNPLFVMALSVLVFLFAMNLFGVFEITLSGTATTSLDKATTREGYAGSFFQGLFATLLATPCTAPFLGSALGFAFTQSPVVILAMFASVAFGMSLPYLLLSARPGWRRFIPKPGAWMERLKQFMAFPLLATNLWLLWVLQNQRGSDAVMAMLVLLFLMGFLAWVAGWLPSMPFGFPRLVVWLVVLAIEGTGLVILIPKIRDARMITQSNHQDGIDWISYTSTALDSLRAGGKPVLIDFTASWCLTCQFNERTAINTPAVRALLKERGITAMKGDWTNADPAITAALKSFGRVGVPLVVFYPAGKESDPVVLPELLTEAIVLETLKK
jgi:thiol:disulfide interchange protein DsbD